MFETVKMIFAILREKDRPREALVLSLDDLCPIWIKFNSSFKPAAVVKETQKRRLPDRKRRPFPATTRACRQTSWSLRAARPS